MGKRKRRERLLKNRREQRERELPLLHDRRAAEKMMADLGRLLEQQEFKSVEEANAFLAKVTAGGKVPHRPPASAVERAQELMYEAWDARGLRRIELAQEALATSRDCPDAYVLLAEETARSVAEAKQWYEQGVAAGERALGPVFFQEEVGHFWGIVKTRPYMRARAGLAECLWAEGDRAEAIEHWQELLRLNPQDNQGLRYQLLSALFQEGRDPEAEDLLMQYEGDAMAAWAYGRALLAFRSGGPTEEAAEFLRTALDRNPHVPAYLLGRKRLPRQLPETISFGGDSEAVEYAVEAKTAWDDTAEALDWLRRLDRERV